MHDAATPPPQDDPLALHDAPAERPWRDPARARLPGIVPLDPGDWLRRDEAHDRQMALRDRLLARRRDAVHAMAPEAIAASVELLASVVEHLLRAARGTVKGGAFRRSDGVRVPLDLGNPLACLGRLVPEDFCVLLKPPGAEEHRLAGAVLCFPAGWTLAEKMGRPLAAIHTPVPAYDDTLARRVQRLCDAVRPGRPLLRANAHLYERPDLFAPRREGDPRPRPATPRYLRVERQTLLRLPVSGAVVFGIHTSVTPVARLAADDRRALGLA